MHPAGAVFAAKSNPVIVNPAGSVQLQFCEAEVDPATGHVQANCASFLTYAVVAIFVELSPVEAVGAVGLPVSAGEASGASEFAAIPESWIVFPFVPLNVAMFPLVELAGPLTFPDPVPYPCAFTHAVVAIFVELSEVAGVGAVGVPLNAGEAVAAIEPSTYAEVTVVHVGAPVPTAVTT